MASDKEEYKFQLVQFLESRDAGLLDIDVVPTSWVSWNLQKNVCKIKYPSPPYDVKVCTNLQRLVQNEKLPPESWLWWDVELKGGADTYETALVRLDKLKTMKFAYTTDGETDPQIKAQKIKQSISKKSTKQLFDVPTLDHDGDTWKPRSGESTEQNSLSSYESSDSSQTPRSKKAQGKKKLHRKPFKKSRQLSKPQVNKKNRTSSSVEDVSIIPDRTYCSQNIVNMSESTRTDSAPSFSRNYYEKNNNERMSKIEPTMTPRDESVAKPRAVSVVILPTHKAKSQTIQSQTVQSISKHTPSPLFYDDNGNSRDGSNDFSNMISDTLNKSATSTPIETSEQMAKHFEKQERFTGTQNLSRDTLFLLDVFKRFSVDLRANTAAVNALRDAIMKKEMVDPAQVTVDQFEEANELQLPFEAVEQFEQFDQMLEGDKAASQTLILSLRQLLDRNNNMTKSVTSILRKFFARDLIIRFTAKKKVEGKTLIKTTNFGHCMIVALVKFHTLPDGTPVNEDAVLKCTGNAISNAKDWDGRKRRTN